MSVLQKRHFYNCILHSFNEIRAPVYNSINFLADELAVFQIQRKLEAQKHNASSLANDSAVWECDTFSWSENCRLILKNNFKLDEFRPLQRLFCLFSCSLK